MVSHDQLFKDFLREFFREFLELFYPPIAARLDFARVTLLDKEFFTDLPTEIYSDLSASEAEEYALLVESEAQEAKAMVSIFEERGIEKGLAIGIEQGREQGIAQGAVNASREHLLALLRHKFGALPQSAAAPLAALQSKAELDALFLRALDAGTLAELGLDTLV